MITVTNLAIQFGKRVLYKDVNLKFTHGNISSHLFFGMSSFYGMGLQSIANCHYFSPETAVFQLVSHGMSL